ncbi:cyclic peptide transporter [Bacillus cereus]|nr:cyclic peptide transporter [Bacillus cereus]
MVEVVRKQRVFALLKGTSIVYVERNKEEIKNKELEFLKGE